MLAPHSLGRWSLAAAVVLSVPGVRALDSRHTERRTTAAGVVFTGTVRDAATGAPMQGAQVRVTSAAFGGTTGTDGVYAFSLPEPAARRGTDVTLEARRIGYQSRTQRVKIVGDTVRADFALAAAEMRLSEVVVTGAAVADARAAHVGSARANVSAKAASVGSVGSVAASSAPAPALMRAPSGYVRADAGGVPGYIRRQREPGNTEAYDRIEENPFLAARTNPLSTFGIDVDRASYSNVRRFVEQGALPPKDAVRLEELVNYFPYDLPAPRGAEPFTVTAETHEAPWKPGHRLVRVALQAKKLDVRELPPSNLVFLIDVSGSMMSPDKLPLVKSAFRLLVDQLREQDRVAIVVYAGNAGLVLPSTSGSDKTRIMEAIDRLEAGGSTAGGAGIRLAYDVARGSHLAHGNNRVILATDGDFNVGTSSDAELERLIESRRDEGTFLTVLGFGTGNLKDAKMEKLADRGNGNYAYVDGPLEAKKVFVHELGGTLLTVAKDVKLQVEFNPARVAAYRLLGYENRLLRDEDFNDDAKDAGDLGAGHAVTALYEVVPVGASDAASVIRGVDPLRYQRPKGSDDDASADAPAAVTPRRDAGGGAELMYVKLRYKEPDGHTSRLMQRAVLDVGDAARARPSDDFTFAAAVAEFALVLRDSEHKGRSSLDHALVEAQGSLGRDEGGYRSGFVDLVRKARALKEGEKPVAVER